MIVYVHSDYIPSYTLVQQLLIAIIITAHLSTNESCQVLLDCMQLTNLLLFKNECIQFQFGVIKTSLFSRFSSTLSLILTNKETLTSLLSYKLALTKTPPTLKKPLPLFYQMLKDRQGPSMGDMLLMPCSYLPGKACSKWVCWWVCQWVCQWAGTVLVFLN